MTEVQDILDAVRAELGIRLTEVHTGGGCMALEARLESGHWIVATDEALCSLRERLHFEQDTDADGNRRALGWLIGIYPHGGDDMDWCGGQESILDVCDWDAYGEQLPDMLRRAIAALASGLRATDTDTTTDTEE